MRDDDARDFADELELRGFVPGGDGRPSPMNLGDLLQEVLKRREGGSFPSREAYLGHTPFKSDRGADMTEDERRTLDLLAKGREVSRVDASLAARRALEMIYGD